MIRFLYMKQAPDLELALGQGKRFHKINHVLNIH
jgi:hypothetical protein